MKLTVKENSLNYGCTVVEIDKIYDIEGADNIKRTVVFGNNIVIGKNVKEGDRMLYFVSGTKLNQDYCFKNNLYSDSEKNYDKSVKGYLSAKQSRVKAIKLRGVISDGILLPLNSLNPFIETANINSLKVGDYFTDINGNSLCEKYIVPVKNSHIQGKALKQPKRISRLVEGQFYLHNDTENLRRNIHKIKPDDIIGIHYKKHGTSICIGNVLIKKNLKWYEKIASRLGVKVVETDYDIVYSSRKVVKNQYLNTETGAGFYGEDIWGVVAKKIGHLIPKNWTLYGEILGYLPNGGYIQSGYDYGCKSGEYKFYVYKISVVNSDGKVVYLTDKQIEEYCEKVGLLYKDTFIYYGVAYALFSKLIGRSKNKNFNLEEWQTKFLELLEKEYNEKDCYMCVNKVPEEGIVLRVERLEYYEAYKLKSKRFLLMESEMQEKEEINIEDNE